MLLHALDELYNRLQTEPDYSIAPQGFSSQKISFKVVVYPDGRLFEIQDARVVENKKKRPRRVLVLGAGKPSGSGLNPCTLWDNAAYMLGFKLDDPKPARTLAAFEAFRKKHLSLEADIGTPSFSTICRFLEAWDPTQMVGDPTLSELSSGFGVFQIVGQSGFVHQDQSIEKWWSRNGMEESGYPDGQCLVCGEERSIAKTHPKIKGVMGAQSSGAAIVSFNDSAYESYGKKQNINAPISEGISFRYTTALNALLDGAMSQKHRLRLGDMTVVFWTESRNIVEDIFAKFSSQGSGILEDDSVLDETLRKKVEIFLSSLRGRSSAGIVPGIDLARETGFYILGLSPNAARLSIRFFHRSTVGALLQNLSTHYNDTKIVGSKAVGKRKADPEFPPSWMLLKQTARDAKDIPPLLAAPLLQSILTGSLYPQGLFSAVVRRIHADREVNYIRARILRGYLVRNKNQEVPMSLDNQRTEPAYRLGRLFSALEKTQYDALNLNTVRDRFYSSASATPGSVFPRLLRTYQHHLAKLEGGIKVNREKLIQEIMGPLDSFPTHLNLADQGLFAIGYYHQTQSFYQKKTETSSNN